MYDLYEEEGEQVDNVDCISESGAKVLFLFMYFTDNSI